ncbi:M15 family metallopeptidase [Escherichia coli]
MSDTTELVDLAVIFPDLEIELKYACADNITGKAIYQQARCLLHKDAITALAKSISIAQLSGLQLVIYDAYRPSVPPAAQRNRLLLNAIMTGGGFVGISSEWWHFELPQAASYPLLADQFSCFISPGTQHVS